MQSLSNSTSDGYSPLYTLLHKKHELSLLLTDVLRLQILPSHDLMESIMEFEAVRKSTEMNLATPNLTLYSYEEVIECQVQLREILRKADKIINSGRYPGDGRQVPAVFLPQWRVYVSLGIAFRFHFRNHLRLLTYYIAGKPFFDVPLWLASSFSPVVDEYGPEVRFRRLVAARIVDLKRKIAQGQEPIFDVEKFCGDGQYRQYADEQFRAHLGAENVWMVQDEDLSHQDIEWHSFIQVIGFATWSIIVFHKVFINNVEFQHELFQKIKVDKITSTPTTQNAEESCHICLEDFGTKKKHEAVQTKCNHVFCSQCLKTWVDGKNNSCPLCRSHLADFVDRLPSKLQPYYKKVDDLVKLFHALGPQIDKHLLAGPQRYYSMELHGLFMTLDKLLGELRSATMTFREKSEKMRPLKYRIAEEIEELRYSLAARLERLREYRLSAEVHLAEFGRADDDGEADGDGQPDNDDEDAWETEEDDGVQPFLFYP